MAPGDGPAPLRLRAAFSAASVVVALCSTIGLAQAQEPNFYDGKQITLMVGSSPGGGYDTIARLIARHLPRYIPGHPAMIVQNMPGGGSITLSNRIYRTERQDGTVMGLVQRGVLLSQLVKQPNVQYEVGGFNWIGSVSPDTSLAVAWHTAAVKTADDLLRTQLVVGGTGVTSDLESSARLLNAAAGTKFKIIGGYPGQADVLLAMERGEVQGTADWSWSEIKTRYAAYRNEGKIALLLQNALRSSPELPDVPLAMTFINGDVDRKVAQLYFAVKQLARPVLMGPAVPADRIALIRTAFGALARDAAYRADAQAFGLDDPAPATEIEQFISLSNAATPDVVSRLTDILNPARN